LIDLQLIEKLSGWYDSFDRVYFFRKLRKGFYWAVEDRVTQKTSGWSFQTTPLGGSMDLLNKHTSILSYITAYQKSKGFFQIQKRFYKKVFQSLNKKRLLKNCFLIIPFSMLNLSS